MDDWDKNTDSNFKAAALQHLFKEGFVTKSNKMDKEAELMALEYMRLLVVEAVNRSVAVAKSDQTNQLNISRSLEIPSEHNAFDISDENIDPDEISFDDTLNESFAAKQRRENKVVTVTPKHLQKIITQLMMDFH
jgi:hypothetical protein